MVSQEVSDSTSQVRLISIVLIHYHDDHVIITEGILVQVVVVYIQGSFLFSFQLLGLQYIILDWLIIALISTVGIDIIVRVCLIQLKATC